MPADLATQMVALNAQQTQGAIQTAVLAKKFEMERQAIAELLPTPSRAPAPDGQGTLVDKTA